MEQPNEPVAPPKQAPKKEKSLFNKILILLITLVIIGGIIYIVISLKYPDILENDKDQDAPIMPPTEKEGLSSSARLIVFILVGGTLIVIAYLVLKSIKNSPEREIPKIPVAPDRAEELFIENFSLRYDIGCIFNGTKKLYKPANPHAINLINKHPYFHTATGDSFLLMEIEVSEGKRQGIHMVILPIDKGEQTIKDGWYRIDTNTPKHTFMLNRTNYPMSSMADKNDRMKLAMLDRIDDGDKATDIMKTMGSTSNQNMIGTPLDNYTGMGDIPPQPYARPRPKPRPRYTRRGYY